jgi:serine/threonine protein kinase
MILAVMKRYVPVSERSTVLDRLEAKQTELIQLLRGLLSSDPAARPSAVAALSSSYFGSSIHQLHRDRAIFITTEKHHLLNEHLQQLVRGRDEVRFTITRRVLLTNTIQFVLSLGSSQFPSRWCLVFDGETGVGPGVVDDVFTSCFEAMLAQGRSSSSSTASLTAGAAAGIDHVKLFECEDLNSNTYLPHANAKDAVSLRQFEAIVECWQSA